METLRTLSLLRASAAQGAAPEQPLNAPEQAQTTAATQSGPLLALQGPRLQASGGSFLGALDQYMLVIMIASVLLASDNAKVAQLQTETGNQAVQESINQANQARDQYHRLQVEESRARHRSFWQKLGSEIAGAVLCVVGLLTGNVELSLMGGLMLAMTASDAQEKMDHALSSKLGLKIVEELGIVIGSAVVMCGLTAALEAGANAAFGAAEEAAAGGASRSLGAGTRLALMSGQMTMVVNPFIDLVSGIEELLRMAGAHISANAQQLSAEITGVILAAIVGFTCAGISVAKVGDGIGQRLVQGFKNALTERGYQFAKYGMMILGAGFRAEAAIFGVLQGTALLKQSSILRAVANTQQQQTLAANTLAMVNDLVQQSRTAQDLVNETYEEMNQRFGAYVDAFATAARLIA
jgi:hypothetical protein